MPHAFAHSTRPGPSARLRVARVARAAPVALIGLFLAFGASGARASSDVRGEAVIHRAPTGVQEQCVMLARMPGARYSAPDEAQERALCAIDFYRPTYALCPKLFSTSPGTLVYDLSAGPYAGRQAAFEREVCTQGRVVTGEAVGGAVSFKMSVNTRETSATFANSSLVYYHFARYFDAAVQVPPAVLRSIDKDSHRSRVALRGEAVSATRAPLKMLHAGWSTLLAAQQDPSSYRPTDELFTADRQRLYGVLLRPQGRRYGEEVNGSRASGWGDGQSRDFQQTAPFIALATDRPLAEAISQGLAQGHASSAIPADGRPQQVAFWMRELIDVTLLDHLFSQQDRIGNIDYVTHWVWVEDGQVRQQAATGGRPPAELAARSPRLLKRTVLADNDAGVRLSYANFTQRTGMLERIRHYPPHTYRQLMRLDADFAASGPLHAHTRATFGLSPAEFDRVAANVQSAAAILRSSCRAGRLRFDLDVDGFVRDGDAAAPAVDCDSPAPNPK
jgi:hypothetical protein